MTVRRPLLPVSKGLSSSIFASKVCELIIHAVIVYCTSGIGLLKMASLSRLELTFYL